MDKYKCGDFFALLAETGEVLPVQLTHDFWESGVMKLPAGSLVSFIETKSDWSVWEMHPAGDEFVYVLTGSMEFVFDLQPAKHLSVAAGEFAVIPKGVWHTANTENPSKALFITRGEGTEHRERQ